MELYSLDGGKLWCSKPSDLKHFKQRKAKAEASAKYLMAYCDGSSFASSVDFWGR
jgi:hypothetical protein